MMYLLLGALAELDQEKCKRQLVRCMSIQSQVALGGRRALGDLQFKAGGKDVVECTPEMRRVELQVPVLAM